MEYENLRHTLRWSHLPFPIAKGLFLIIACLSFCSCAMVGATSQKSGPAGAEGKPETFYVGQDGLKLFAEPRFSKECLATLPLNEKVVRDKLEKGFAHVRVVGTGQTGWVNNAHLVWKAPSEPKPAPSEPAAAEEKSSAPEVIEAPSEPDPEVEGPGAAIFNRF